MKDEATASGQQENQAEKRAGIMWQQSTWQTSLRVFISLYSPFLLVKSCL